MNWKTALVLLIGQALILLMVFSFTASAAVEEQVKGVTVTLTPDQVEMCRVEGGCVVVSQKRAQAWRQEGFEVGVAYARVQCRRYL